MLEWPNLDENLEFHEPCNSLCKATSSCSVSKRFSTLFVHYATYLPRLPTVNQDTGLLSI
jgi:hypothetical protein